MRAIAIIAALAMVAGLFLPWLNTETSGLRLVPWDIVKGLDPTLDTAMKFAQQSPPELLAYLATFVLAALFALLAILGAPSRVLALLAGGGAVGIVAYGVLRMKDQIAALGIPVPSMDALPDFLRSAPEVFGMGAFAWAGGGVLLLLTGLAGFPRR
jgi:hypothetical protein